MPSARNPDAILKSESRPLIRAFFFEFALATRSRKFVN
jgi:hypothetical protein